ncbi:MAG TPA: cytochrome P450 [Pseudomonadales bacterium]|nr:cytochrome P450 [Pseudomonadales bacterium]
MAEATLEVEAALPDPQSCALDQIDVSDARIFEGDCWQPYFARLRAEDPVHFTAASPFGAFWSITRFDDIKAVDMNHEAFSSEPVIVIGDPPADFTLPQFIAMDQPRHDAQRKAVQPAVAPRQLANLEPLIRQRVCAILDELPVGEEFDWVPRVSIELTTQMLATLFDFPFEDRHLLPYWSDAATSSPELTGSTAMTDEERRRVLMECLAYFDDLWQQRQDSPGDDFITLMAHSPAFKGMAPLEYLGNLILLIVGGNDTTRNSITGGVYALNRFPEQYAKLRETPSLIPNMVAEVIRWQTPLPHMRRNCIADTQVGDKLIRKGDKVVMWYVSGNRDEAQFEAADDFVIDRPNARSHVSFGYGIHRCMGNRLGEMQLRILWEEILARFHTVEVRAEPTRLRSNFVKGYTSMPVVLHAH